MWDHQDVLIRHRERRFQGKLSGFLKNELRLEIRAEMAALPPDGIPQIVVDINRLLYEEGFEQIIGRRQPGHEMIEIIDEEAVG